MVNVAGLSPSALVARVAVVATALLLATCETSSRSSPEVSSPASVAPSPSLTFAAEITYVYALELDTVVQYGVDSELSLTLQGRVQLQREASEPGSLTLAAALPDARVLKPEPGTEQQFVALAAELRQGFVIALDAGKITEVRSVGSVSTFAANIMRTLAAAFELPAPPAAEQASWTADTVDAAGRHVVELTRLADAGHYRKRKLRYAETQLGWPVLDEDLLALDLDLSEMVKLGFDLSNLTSQELNLHQPSQSCDRGIDLARAGDFFFGHYCPSATAPTAINELVAMDDKNTLGAQTLEDDIVATFTGRVEKQSLKVLIESGTFDDYGDVVSGTQSIRVSSTSVCQSSIGQANGQDVASLATVTFDPKKPDHCLVQVARHGHVQRERRLDRPEGALPNRQLIKPAV
jgi:hypothetical protein